MGLVVVVLSLGGGEGWWCWLCTTHLCARTQRENKINILIEVAMNSVSTIVLRLLFIVKIFGHADALVLWMSLVKFLTKNYFIHPDVSALNTSGLFCCDV